MVFSCIPVSYTHLDVYKRQVLSRPPRSLWADAWRRLVRKVNRSNVGITLDVGHAVIAGHNPLDYVHLLFDELFHVHLHDNHGETDEHLPLGQGVIDYVGLIQTLKQLGYQGAITLEFDVEDPDRFADYLY